MKEAISPRQTGMLCVILILANKILILPSLMYQSAKSDGLFMMAFLFLIELLVLFAFFKLKKRFPSESLDEILSMSIGKILAKIVYLILMAFFLFKVFLTFSTAFMYLKLQVYQGEFVLLAIICVVPVINHAVFSGLRTFSRTIELFFYIVVAGFVTCLLLSLFAIDTTPLFFTSNIKDLGQAWIKHVFSFGDYIFLFLVIDKINIENKHYKQIFRYALLGIGLVLTLFFLFYSLYQVTAFMHNNAISDILVFSIQFNAVGRIDVIAMLTLMFLSLFQMEIFNYGFVNSFTNFFPKLNKIFGVVIFDVLFIIVYFVFIGKYENMLNFFEGWLGYFAIVVDYVVPFMLFCISFKKQGKVQNDEPLILSDSDTSKEENTNSDISKGNDNNSDTLKADDKINQSGEGVKLPQIKQQKQSREMEKTSIKSEVPQ